jgi:hypothetical protein
MMPAPETVAAIVDDAVAIACQESPIARYLNGSDGDHNAVNAELNARSREQYRRSAAAMVFARLRAEAAR